MSAVLESERHARGAAAAEVFVGMLRLLGYDVRVAEERFSHSDMTVAMGGRKKRVEFKYRPTAFRGGSWQYPDAIVDVVKLANNDLMVWMRDPGHYALVRTSEAEGLPVEPFHDPERDQISDIVRVPADWLTYVGLPGLTYELSRP